MSVHAAGNRERQHHGARLWQQFAEIDGKPAFQAIRALIRNPGPAVALIRARLKAAEANDGKRVKHLLGDLGGDDFATRETAVRELVKLGDRIEGLLVEGTSGRPSLETKRRIEALMAKLDTPTPERLARWRALEALEQIATPEAVRLLETLAAGAPEARLTREAAAVLDRVRKQ